MIYILICGINIVNEVGPTIYDQGVLIVQYTNIGPGGADSISGFYSKLGALFRVLLALLRNL